MPRPPKNGVEWNKQEDDQLKLIVLELEVGGPNNVSWADVADALQQALASYYSSVNCERTTKQCRERCVLAAPPSTALRFPQQPPTIPVSLRRYLNVLNPDNYKRGEPWGEQEHDLLMRLVIEHGRVWETIATHVPGRSEAWSKCCPKNGRAAEA